MAAPSAKNGKAAVARELIKPRSSGAFAGLASLRDGLTRLGDYIDLTEREHGHDIYERVALDSCVEGNLKTLVGLTLAEGVSWKAGQEAPDELTLEQIEAMPADERRDREEQQARYDRAVEVQQEFEDDLTDLHIQERLKEMLRAALINGHKVAELVWDEDILKREGAMRLRAIKPKPRKAVAFVVDEFNNLKGIAEGQRLDVLNEGASVHPPEKFLILTHEQRNHDPRGTSALRSAYNWWYIKTHCLPGLLKMLAQFGSPSLVGEMPPQDASSEMVYDEEGELIDADAETNDFLSQLLSFENGTAIVHGNGGRVYTLYQGSDGSAFERAIKSIINAEITYAMLGQVHATMEAQHQSRATSSTGKDILDVIVSGLKDLITDMMRSLSLLWVTYNYGEEEAKMYAPHPVLEAVAAEDRWQAAEQYRGLKAIDGVEPEHENEWFAAMGFSPIDVQVLSERLAAVRSEREQMLADRARLLNPEDETEVDAS